MVIAEMQQKILGMGWQFREHIFNDGGPECCLEVSPSKSPHVFHHYSVDEESREERKKNLGWGRFSRQYCWESALELITKIAAGEAMQ